MLGLVLASEAMVSFASTRADRLSRFALIYDHLRPLRVPLLVMAIGSAATVAVDQVSELFLMATLSASAAVTYVYLLLGCLLAGLAIWYQSRNAFRMRYARWPALDDPRGAALRTWLPRALGAAVPLLVAVGCAIAYDRMQLAPGGRLSRLWFVGCLAGLVMLSAGLMAFFVGRRTMLNAAARRMQRSGIAPAPDVERRVWRVAELGPIPRLVFLAALALNVLITVLIAWRPYWLDPFGPLAILLLAGTFFCISGGYITLLSDRRGLPLLGALALMATLWHLTHANDNHRVRLQPGMSTHWAQPPPPAPQPAPPTFAAYRDAWLRLHCAGRDPCPVVLVSSEGGGIRAAAWTAMVLTELDRAGGGAVLARTFAGSGVSGGSLGLATVVALRRDLQDAAHGDLQRRAELFLARDFLSPTLANLLFVDFTQRLLPGAWFDDRGRALTETWEAAYADLGGSDAFARPFAALYRRGDGGLDARVPALFLNSTVVGSGARFVQHPFAQLPQARGHGWFAAVDGARHDVAAMPLSEVVLNSARFTYISPAGTLPAADPNGAPLQLVDGGYFENSGTATLHDVIAALRAGEGGPRLQLRIVHISNDPSAPAFAPRPPGAARADDRCAVKPAPPPPHGDATAPLAALLSTREARGRYAREALRHRLEPGDRLWHFRLCKGEYVIPLGWTISAPVFAEMRRQLRQRYAVREIARELGATDPDSP